MGFLSKKNLGRLSLITLLFLTAFFISGIFSAANTSLYNNQNWIVSKTRFKGVMGAYGFLGSSNSLAGNHLDLSKWFGFQELIYKDSLNIQEITFDFFLDPESYLVFVFNKNEGGFSGIRVSHHSLFKSIYFTSKNSGEFVNTEVLSIPPLRPSVWNHYKMVFSPKGFSIYLNGEFVKDIKCELSQKQQIGFRGGMNKVLIDNILIRIKNSHQAIRESFHNRNRVIFFICGIVGVFVINGLAMPFLYAFKKRPSSNLLAKLMVFNTCLFVFSFIYYQVNFYYLWPRYPQGKDFTRYMPRDFLAASSKYWSGSAVEFIRAHIKDTYMREKPENVFKILFIGSSQTWGAGASEESRTFTNLLERRFNKSGDNATQYECINAGIPGLDSSSLLHYYKSEWITLNPKIVVINLSSNDQNPKVFSSNLEAFARLNREHNIETIFVLEANAVECFPVGPPLHKAMKEVAEKNNIATVDLHGYLCKNYDRGFLWWDYVHLTDFGQELTANYLYETISKMVASINIKVQGRSR